MAEQIRAVSTHRFGRRLGVVAPTTMDGVTARVRLFLDLSPRPLVSPRVVVDGATTPV